MTQTPDPAHLSPRRLRDAFGCFATGVTVVTVFDAEGEPLGLTANSFTSVSLDPPLLLFCIDRKSRRAPAVQAAPTFAVNVLHAGQEALSGRFARSRSDGGFSGVAWETWGGAPALVDAMATFACSPYDVHDGGDHLVIIGRVERLRTEPAQDPLIFFQGRYRSVHVPE
jgi:flavin reductase (DIM6/NTAB) family NADH-FMN oxidoreductase RutF